MVTLSGLRAKRRDRMLGTRRAPVDQPSAGERKRLAKRVGAPSRSSNPFYDRPSHLAPDRLARPRDGRPAGSRREIGSGASGIRPSAYDRLLLLRPSQA